MISGRGALLAVIAALPWAAPGALAAPPASRPAITLRASARQIENGRRVILSGVTTGVPSRSIVRLYESPYPFPIGRLAATTPTTANGSYRFAVRPDRDTRYRVVLLGTTATALIELDVTGKTLTKVKALPLGRAKVVLVVFHPRDLHWARGRVEWWFTEGSRRFVRFPATRPIRLSPYVAVLSTSATLPAGRFGWRACLHAPGDRALANPRRPPGCTGRGYHGGGSLPVGFPGPGAIARAGGYLAGRAGHTAFAVVDSEGRLSGVRIHDRFLTASVVKAMLLVEYLRRLDARGQHHVDSYSNSFLYPMIHVSDNNAATQCWSIVGDGGLYAIARAAGMTDFSVAGFWLTAMTSPADQARFFFEMDSLIPREFVGYARFLLSTIDPSQSWGTPPVGRPLGYQVFFKGGWLPSRALVNQVARLEGHHRTFAIATMTDSEPDMGYGIDTIQGVTAALLR